MNGHALDITSWANQKDILCMKVWALLAQVGKLRLWSHAFYKRNETYKLPGNVTSWVFRGIKIQQGPIIPDSLLSGLADYNCADPANATSNYNPYSYMFKHSLWLNIWTNQIKCLKKWVYDVYAAIFLTTNMELSFHIFHKTLYYFIEYLRLFQQTGF